MNSCEITSSLSNISKFSAIPGVADPEALAVCYRQYLLRSMEIYLKKISESLKLDLTPFIQKIKSLDVKERFSPALFVYYDHLKEGYRAKNLHQMFDAIQAFKNLNDSGLTVKEIQYTTILTETWEFLCLNALRQTPLDELGEPTVKPIQMLPLVHWDKNHFPPRELIEATDLLRVLDADLFLEFQSYVTDIKLYAGKILESTTSSRFFGAIFLRLPFPEENGVLLYLRNITHEISHLHLYAMSAEDLIVLNPENERFTSPLREDKRPMIGIFHAAFVLSRMVRVFRKFLTLFPEDEEANAIFKKNTQSFLDGIETIEAHARLTEKGKDIFNSMKACAFEHT